MMGAMCVNGHLGLIFREDCTIQGPATHSLLLHIGVPDSIARSAVRSNFHGEECPECPRSIDVREMNTVSGNDSSSPWGAPQEHMYSTGIRDGPSPDVGLYDIAERTCLDPDEGEWRAPHIDCLVSVWNRRDGGGVLPVTNDVNNRRLDPSSCAPTQSDCPSQLGSSIRNLHTVFQTGGGISRAAFRSLWLEGQYP